MGRGEVSAPAAPRSQRANLGDDQGAADLELAGVVRGWGRPRKRRTVLDGVDLLGKAGTVTWIGGVNGIGKTTLLRVAAGILAAESGHVRFGAIDPETNREEYHRATALISAGDRGLYARISVRRQLKMQARLALIPSELRTLRVNAAVENFGLAGFVDARTDQLSLGQRQRVRLALSLLHEPQLVLLDEPANSLDEEGLAFVASAVAAITGRGGVVLWCSPPHERSVIPSDTELLLEDGQLRAS